MRYTPAPAERSPVPLFAYLGRLKRYKGVDLVIRAFAEAALGRDATLRIAGAGDHRPALESLARSLDLDARVSSTGLADIGKTPRVFDRHRLIEPKQAAVYVRERMHLRAVSEIE